MLCAVHQRIESERYLKDMYFNASNQSTVCSVDKKIDNGTLYILDVTFQTAADALSSASSGSGSQHSVKVKASLLTN